MNKQLLKQLILSFILASSALAAERPNVLFIAIDDLNDWVGVFGGHPQAKTPNLDRLNAMGGMVMYDAHASSTVCGPSRSSLLTGKFPHSTGVYGNNTNIRNAPKAKDLLTLPQYFSQHGYHTLTRGKIFHAHEWEGEPRADQGQWAFDEWVDPTGWAPPISDERPVNGLISWPGDNSYHSGAFDWGPTKGNDETLTKDHHTARWAAEQLLKRDFDKPFFMAVGFSQPHLQWWIPQKYFDRFPFDEVIMLWGDHGWHLGEKQYYGKATLWKESSRVPLMVKVPGVTKPNSRSYGIVNLIDMYPTLIQLCGLPPNPENEGRSFAELLHKPEMTWNEPTLTDWTPGGHRIYDGRYSYIIYKRNGQEELYDLKVDPNEWRNLANNPEYAAIKKRLATYVPEDYEPMAPKTRTQ
ncbi:MAG: sulfatase-like hydrolase/transferase [Verrucomicrobia bacterium]|jgi:arylsulfatase A-like enzyme|nr:sulfatase-like hydrolase/transferase [Verrucomicrobiota bacterium]